MEVNPNACIIIKSTVSVGCTAALRQKFHTDRILFSPEFLREGKALYDNLYPTRIIVGVEQNHARQMRDARMFADILKGAALKPEVPVLYMSTTEAESVKLFSNAYLAMRVAFLMNSTLMRK